MSTEHRADTARLFLALCPDEAVQAAVAEHAAQWRWNVGTNLYTPPDWHITLHFIGAVPRSRLDEMRGALDVPMTPFELRFGEPQRWPHGLAVLLAMAVPGALQRLYDQLGQRLRQLGVRTEERAYRPHFTLARHAEKAVVPAQPPAWGWHVQGYALMESTGDPAERYRVLQRYGKPDTGPALRP